MQHQLRDECANSSFTVCTSYRQMGPFHRARDVFPVEQLPPGSRAGPAFPEYAVKESPDLCPRRQHVLRRRWETGVMSPQAGWAWFWGLGWELVTAKNCGRSRAGLGVVRGCYPWRDLGDCAV